MGSCTSNIEKLIPKQWMEVFQIMQLTRSEIRHMHHLYKNYATGDPNGMDVVEWLTLIDIDRTSLSERLFWASDRDGDHLLNFYEFVLSLWRFCVLGDGSLNIFAFDMYDTDGDGILRIDALTLMFRELLGEAHATSGTNKFVLSDLRKHYPDGSLTSEQWRPFSQTHQVLFHEIFTIQRKMRKHTLGESQWHAIGKRKVQLAAGKFVPVSQLMLLHSDRHMFESLLLDKNKLHLSKGRKLVLTLTENAHTYHTKHVTHNKAEREADEAEYQQRLPANTHHEDVRAGEHVTHSHQSAHRWAERHYGEG